ncbi:patatin-domain-containing protein [Mucor ambiguus]|uniref:Lysophospholipase NTE1 n=1 Tax=Mucor ambiguus TaxID=91626 RepID=A0A0C9N1Q3_9FUNG|nr:patatin-domain-containing protein [Mucor ambiguus]
MEPIVKSVTVPPPTDVLYEAATQPHQQRSMLTQVIGFVPMLLLKVVGFATISIPVFFYRVLTWSFTLHLNFSSLLVILAVMATVAYLIVRYRFLTKYSRLKPINKPPKVASSFDLHPDTGDEDYADKPGGYKNYPDEFLSAFLSSIKIFGYLEQPVFHELARHLQTKKLLAGDTLFRNPEQERSFYIVVDGHVQMFVKPDNASDEQDSSDESDYEEGIAGDYKPWKDDDEFMDSDNSGRKRDKFRKYTLINEVSAGGTLSSLFTILSIFRESFNRSEAKERQRQKSTAAAAMAAANTKAHLSRMAPTSADMSRETSTDEWRQVFPGLEEPVMLQSRPDSETSVGGGLRRRSKTSQLHQTTMSDMEDNYFTGEQDTHALTTDALNSIAMPMPLRKLSGTSSQSRLARPELYSHSSIARRSYRSVHPNIIARATVDTTLAVIPEEAFHKLTQKFPKAAAHIVQVIVTRFQRVTLMTSHRYLGLTKELLRLEKLVNESASLLELPPNFFAPGGMDRLRRKFNDEETSSEGDGSLGPSEISRSESSGIIQAIGIIDIPETPSLHINSPANGGTANLGSSPVSASKGGSSHLTRQKLNRKGEYSVEDDEHLRTSVMHCISDALGIKATPTAGSGHHGNDPHSRSSPRAPRRFPQYPMDLFTHTGSVGSTGSPSLDPFDGPYYDDDIDARSTSSSVHSGNHTSDIFSHSKHVDPISPEDVQILYFPKDAVLVREGAHNNGLFFVIDGLLEASMTPTAGEDVLGNVGQDNKGKSKKDKKSRQSLHHRKSRIVDSDFNLTPTSSTSSVPQAERPADPSKVSSTSAKEDKVVASDAPAGRSNENDKNEDDHETAKKPLFIIKPGGLAGYLDALTGFPSFVEIRAKTDTYVGYVSKKRLDRITDKNPSVMLKLANQLVGHVSPLILHIDISLEWMQVNAGQIICREGEPSDAIYMVLHGRLRTIHEKKEGEIEILGEFGHGDSVGELEVLTGVPTSSTLHAIRDTELARMPKTLFNALALRHPEITLQISRMVAFRSLQLVMHRNSPGSGGSKPPNMLHLKTSADASAAISSITSNGPNSYPELYGRNNVNLKTIGIIPVNSSVPISEFAESLKTELLHSVGATCALLNGASVTTMMGKYAFSRLGKLKMASWLADQEEKYRIVLYLADSGVTSQWTRTCIRQSDCILLVGLGDGDPSVGEYERFLINMKTTARKELVLLHGERSCASGTTQNWLKNRLWIQAHHHIYMPMKQHAALAVTERFRPPWLAEQGRKMTAGSINMLANVKDQIKEYYSAVPNFGRLLDVKKTNANSINAMSSPARNDFARLARRLCGKSVALVLGGGGARGVGHVGVIQAIEEAGIPIDIIGGTSIGSFVGGLYARNMDLVSVIARSKMFAGRVSSIWRQIMDLTYPVTAWFTGHEFNRAIWKCLGDSQIEDYWLPFYAVTTNITFSRMEVHTTGYAWRYIRASMSLSGYMPPICDNGNMLVDGGYMDNLPVSVAKDMGADIIIAVDVASEDDTSPVYYGDSISGWWALLHGFNPFRTYNVPSIADIQSRLAYVSSVSRLEEAKVTDGTLYLKLPVQQWGTLEFAKYNDIFQKGYDVGREVVSKWRKAGYASGRISEGDHDGQLAGKEVKGKRGRRNSI